jgi:hypothetical protein
LRSNKGIPVARADAKLAQLVREIVWSHNITILESARADRSRNSTSAAPESLADLGTTNLGAAIDPAAIRTTADCHYDSRISNRLIRQKYSGVIPGARERVSEIN